MARNDSNIDPFNAGEPSLPWDDPSALADERGRDAGGYEAPQDSYDGPVKTEDDYQAPQVNTEDDVPKPDSSREQERRRAASSSGPRSHTGTSASSPNPVARPKRKSIWFIIILICAATGFGSEVIDQVSNGFDSFFGESSTSDNENGAESQPASDSASAADTKGTDKDADSSRKLSEKQARKIAQDRLDELANDTEVKSWIASALSQKIQKSLAYSADELGIDTNAYAAWMLENTSFEFTKAYVFDTASNPSASLYFNASAPSTSDVFNQSCYDAQEYFMNQKIYYWDGRDKLPAPTDEQKTQVQSLFTARQQDPKLATTSLNIELIYRDGAWTVDNGSLQRQLQSVYLLY